MQRAKFSFRLGAKLDFFKMDGNVIWQALLVILVALTARFISVAAVLPLVERSWVIKVSSIPSGPYEKPTSSFFSFLFF